VTRGHQGERGDAVPVERVARPGSIRTTAYAFAFAVVALAALASVLSARTRSRPLTVFAAASLTDAFEEIGREFEAAHAGTTVSFNFAGSQILRTQIEQGARADVFASADTAHASALERAGLLVTPRTFAHNALVVVTPARAPRVHALEDLAAPGVSIVLADAEVPVGRYARRTLDLMKESERFGPAFVEGVFANVVSEETNVRAVLAKVSLGEADAGFVYRTDVAAAARRVNVIPIPEPWVVTAEYVAGACTEARAPGPARAFLAYLAGPEAQAVLRKYGFEP
jgi:molybdate transport system substrate-binding protein